MNRLVTTAIILKRTNYGEADRILTLLTPNYGKLTLIAKGVRREKSKMAGGIELFSVSEVTFIKGRGEVGTLVSSRLIKHYERIVKNLDRTTVGYECIKQIATVTEDEAEAAYFELLHDSFEALDTPEVPLAVVQLWFGAQLLRLSGHAPNVETDAAGRPLNSNGAYEFDHDAMAFFARDGGRYGAEHIKLLRLACGGNSAIGLARIAGGEALAAMLTPLISTMLRSTLRV